MSHHQRREESTDTHTQKKKGVSSEKTKRKHTNKTCAQKTPRSPRHRVNTDHHTRRDLIFPLLRRAKNETNGCGVSESAETTFLLLFSFQHREEKIRKEEKENS
jgi:hypothetical protein